MGKKLLLFPGQGSLNKEKAKEMFEQDICVRETLQEVGEYAGNDIGKKLTIDVELDIFSVSYIIFALSLSSFRKFSKEELENAIFAGHSLGEISALSCAGAFSIKDTVTLITKRAELASSILDAGMLIITKINSQVIGQLCKTLRESGEKIWISCDNETTQTCIAGSSQSLFRAEVVLKQLGAGVYPIEGNLPYHCEMLKEKVIELKYVIESLNMHSINYVVLSNAFAKPYEKNGSFVRNLCAQFTEVVRWRECMDYIRRQQYEEYYEMGYSHILSNIFAKNVEEE